MSGAGRGATRAIHAAIELPAPVSTVFDLLVTPSAICRWWGAATAIVIPREGGIWAATWGADPDAPDYIASGILAVYEPPRRLRLARQQYVAAAGGEPPFSGQLTTEFVVEPAGAGCVLRVVNDGFPPDEAATPFYEGCVQGWKDTLAGVRRVVEEDRRAAGR